MRERLGLALLVAMAALATTCLGTSNPLVNPLLAPASTPPSQALLPAVLDANVSLSNCKPTGQISDARCDYETVEKDINSSNFVALLSGLVREKYFRFYKVDLYKDCPFWSENSLCMSRDCTVSKVDEVSGVSSAFMPSVSPLTRLATVANPRRVPHSMPVLAQDD